MATIELMKKGRKRLNEKAFDRIRDAGKKEVVIMRSEWKLVTPPGAHILRKYLKAEYVVRSLATGKGWLVKRV